MSLHCLRCLGTIFCVWTGGSVGFGVACVVGLGVVSGGDGPESAVRAVGLGVGLTPVVESGAESGFG